MGVPSTYENQLSHFLQPRGLLLNYRVPRRVSAIALCVSQQDPSPIQQGAGVIFLDVKVFINERGVTQHCRIFTVTLNESK